MARKSQAGRTKKWSGRGTRLVVATAGVEMLQGDLFAQGEPEVSVLAEVRRTQLDSQSWIERSSRWVHGGDELLTKLATSVRWTGARRQMYGRMVEEPRLGAQLQLGSTDAPRAITSMGKELSKRYRCRFRKAWIIYYRNGDDSVAWHSDTIGMRPADSLVAIVSLGGPRRLLMRPKGGGPSTSFTLASGDLLVMGGACQQKWEHSVPKVRRAPPRMSVTFRHS